MTVKRYTQPVVQTTPEPGFHVEEVPLFEDPKGKYVLAADFDKRGVELAECNRHGNEAIVLAAKRTEEAIHAHARIAQLEAALREIAEEVSAIGCEGPFDDVCFEYAAPIEDWCPWCRIGHAILKAVPPVCGEDKG